MNQFSVNRTDRFRAALAASALVSGLAMSAHPAHGGMLAVANPSFESPNSLAAGGVYPEADGWVETGPVDGTPPEFPGFTVPPGGPFTLDTGVFYNSPVVTNPAPPPDFVTNPSYVVNADGGQLAYLFAKDDADISFQQTLGATYEADTTYTFTAGVGKSFFLPPIDVDGGTPTMELRLVYEDDGGDLQLVAQTPVSVADVSDVQLTDFSATAGPLAADNPAVGKSIGLWLGSTVGTSGVWILDSVRVSSVPEPASLAGLGLLGLAMLRRRRR